ncbi:MAG TPA: cupin domain-containing protein [Dehalococcoidia bacterium]|nr:cupin domain-containing protein [Dehalococcoidia bacterium]
MAEKFVRFGEKPEEVHWLGGIGARIIHQAPDGSLSIVEHPIKPRGLASSVHTHVKEDEYSYVIRGEVGFELAGESFTAGAGSFVAKPRNIPHAFWNAGDEPALVLEIISPSGFENFFVEMAAVFPTDRPPGPEDFAKFLEIAARYDLNLDLASVPRLVADNGLDLG